MIHLSTLPDDTELTVETSEGFRVILKEELSELQASGVEICNIYVSVNVEL